MSTTSPEIGMGWGHAVGRPGVRNHVIAFSTVALVDRVTELAAAKVPGTLALAPRFERGLRGANAALQARMIAAVVAHPNVGAALVVAHDRAAAEALTAQFAQIDKPVIVRALIRYQGVFNPSAMPLAPTIKICGNPETLNTWASSIDLDVSALLSGQETLDQGAGQILALLPKIAAGHQTRSEYWGEGQLILPRVMQAL